MVNTHSSWFFLLTEWGLAQARWPCHLLNSILTAFLATFVLSGYIIYDKFDMADLRHLYSANMFRNRGCNLAGL
jgi:ATP/ADP translocase